MKAYAQTVLFFLVLVACVLAVPYLPGAHADHVDGCDHGNSNTDCRPDPQPDHGKDCDPHGKPGVGGGENEDHCGPSASPTPPEEEVKPPVSSYPDGPSDVEPDAEVTPEYPPLVKTGVGNLTLLLVAVGFLGWGVFLTNRGR